MARYIAPKKLDLLELSDVFCRHARFAKKSAIGAPDARFFVDAARRVICLSSYYNCGGTGHNESVDREIRKEIMDIAARAKDFGLKEIILPIKYDSRDLYAVRIRNIIKKATLATPVRLRSKTYDEDMSHFGPIDKDVKTVLDDGMRGLLSLSKRYKARCP